MKKKEETKTGHFLFILFISFVCLGDYPSAKRWCFKTLVFHRHPFPSPFSFIDWTFIFLYFFLCPIWIYFTISLDGSKHPCNKLCPSVSWSVRPQTWKSVRVREDVWKIWRVYPEMMNKINVQMSMLDMDASLHPQATDSVFNNFFHGGLFLRDM